MTRRFLALLLALCCLFALIPAAEATALVPCMTIDDTILFIGDSNTVALKSYNTDLNPARVYARVSGRIDECVENWSRYHAYGYDKGIYQLLCELSGDDFDTVVINMGTNNIGYSLTKYRSDYAKLLDNLYEKNPDAVIYVCLILPTNPAGNEPTYTPEAVHAINEQVADVQAEYAAMGRNVRLLDLNTPFADSNGILLSEYDRNGNGVHLNAKGYRKMDQIIQTALAAGDPNANHQWDEGALCAGETCIDGMLVYTCTVCGAQKSEAVIGYGAHDWGEPQILQSPTCTETGLQKYSCTLCGTTYEETTPALGHAWTLESMTDAADTPHASTGLYACVRCGETKEGRLCAAEVFTDMPAEGNWAHDPIDWAWFNGITSGKTPTTFAPKDTVTRAEAMTFLWKTLGSPMPETTENPFEDVKEGKYYYYPVLWAVENEITSGTGETTFGPKEPCTRAQILTFIWIAAGRPEPETTENPFTDVKEGKYYYKAVLWGVENHITSGIAPDEFGTNNTCTRAQIVAFLYKAKDLMTQDPTVPDPQTP